MADIAISHVSFNEQAMEISYQEARDVNEGVMLVRTLVIEQSQIRAEVEELFSMIQDIVDVVLTDLYKQPTTISSRLAARRTAPAEDTVPPVADPTESLPDVGAPTERLE